VQNVQQYAIYFLGNVMDNELVKTSITVNSRKPSCAMDAMPFSWMDVSTDRMKPAVMR